METLNIEKFNPSKAELQKVADEYSNLTIDGMNDMTGYLVVDNARKDLKQKRIQITKTGKALRKDARDFASGVIKLEKDLIGIIEPLELSLREKQEKINSEKEMIKRKELLPERKGELARIEVELSDDEILKMDDNEFKSYYNEKKEEFIESKRLASEQKIEDEKKKLADEKAKFEEDKRVAEATKVAEKEAQDTAVKDAEVVRLRAIQDKDDAIEKEKQKAQKEKDDLVAKHKKEDDDRIAKEKEDKRIADEKLADEKREKEEFEKKKQYQKFLKDNGYTEATKKDFYISNDGTLVTLYKKVNQFKIINKKEN